MVSKETRKVWTTIVKKTLHARNMGINQPNKEISEYRKY